MRSLRPVSLVWLAALLLLGACAHVPDRNPLPTDGVEEATVLGIERARMWGDAPPPWVDEWFGRSGQELEDRYAGVYGKPHNYLALSGGGDNGAFAAGLLVGWTAAGDRPEFTVVTGVSAGALLAPFAFLGPEYDDKIREVSAELKAEDVYERRRLLSAIRSDAAATTEPLQAMIATYVDEEVMQKIATAHRQGRELHIGTVNLDSQRPVIWRIGAIADSGHPNALRLIRQVLLASASIPGAFPPVIIPVEYAGRMYDELHVDGGAASQVFLYPVGVNLKAVHERMGVNGTSKVYIIRNGRLDPLYEQVEPKLFTIADRSLSSMIRTQGVGDLFRIYLETCRDGLDFNLAYIPASFTETPREDFDSEYMRKLFESAFAAAKSGYPWDKMPPELKAAPMECRSPALER